MIMDCNFIAIYSRFANLGYRETVTFKEANLVLQTGSDNCECMPISIIHGKSNKMVWHDEYLGAEECQERTNEFVSKHFT